MNHRDDPEAAVMRALYNEHAAALWRYALRLTGDRARAEDVVQETLMRAWRHPDVTADWYGELRKEDGSNIIRGIVGNIMGGPVTPVE